MARAKPKTPEQQAAKLARKLLPEVHAMKGGFVVVGVSNHTEADQRYMIRSKEKETVRKLTRIEKLLRAGTIERHEAQACQWYADAHSLGYDTLGITASYGGATGGTYTQATHLAKYRAQLEAREDYAFAKAGVPHFLRKLFERVVLEGESLNTAGCYLFSDLGRTQRAEKVAAAFRLAANCLHGHIAHMLPVE